MSLIWQAVAGLNLLAFCTYGIDKWKARHGRRRVPEATLLWMAALAAAPGAFLAMRLFGHKTRKPKFAVGVPVMLLAQLVLAFVWRRAG